jgi:hypothetical protein
VPVRKLGQIIGLATAPIAAGMSTPITSLFRPSSAEHAIGTDLMDILPEQESATFVSFEQATHCLLRQCP